MHDEDLESRERECMSLSRKSEVPPSNLQLSRWHGAVSRNTPVRCQGLRISGSYYSLSDTIDFAARVEEGMGSDRVIAN